MSADSQRPPDSAWGQAVARERDPAVIRFLHDQKASGTNSIDDQTWGDLELEAYFAHVDRTTSAAGQQVLYHQLREYVFDPGVIAERVRQQELFRKDAGLRAAVLTSLRRLGPPEAPWLVKLLFSSLPAKPRHSWSFSVLTAGAVFFLLGTFFIKPLVLPALACLLANVLINATYGQRIGPYFHGFSQVTPLLLVAAELAKAGNPHALPQIDVMVRQASLVAKLRRKFGGLMANSDALGEIGQSANAYLNWFFLKDVRAFLRCHDAWQAHREDLLTLLEAAGSLDAAIAVASCISSTPRLTRPEMTAGRAIRVEGMLHFMIADAVANDLTLDERSALITGPNMSGKTMFIRTVGFNVVLANTLGYCLATHAVLPAARVLSSIRRSDDPAAGESYFFAELTRVRFFLEASPDGRAKLLLIDEIFRGTNTAERIAASAAVLDELARSHQVLVSTHDLELQPLIAGRFDVFHFGDQVTAGRYHFDYCLRPGPVRSRNALRLLALTGFPPHVVARAGEIIQAREEP